MIKSSSTEGPLVLNLNIPKTHKIGIKKSARYGDRNIKPRNSLLKEASSRSGIKKLRFSEHDKTGLDSEETLPTIEQMIIPEKELVVGKNMNL